MRIIDLGDYVETPYGNGVVIKVIHNGSTTDYMILFEDGSRFIVVGRLVK